MPWVDNDGSALQPSFAFESEQSLGWYRSAASTLALSYGTLQVSGLTNSGNNITVGQASVGTTSTGAQFVVANDANNNDCFRVSRSTNSDVWVFGCGTGGQPNNLNFRDSTAAINVLSLGSKGIVVGSIAQATVGLWLDVKGAIGPNSGTAITPSYAYNSEVSLGWHRSATSTVGLSYGTLDLTLNGAVLSVATLKIKAGVNNSCGTAVLGSNGSVNVANTYVAAGDLIFLTDQTAGGTLGDIELGGIRAGSGFTILSTSITDTSTVAWLIVRPT